MTPQPPPSAGEFNLRLSANPLGSGAKLALSVLHLILGSDDSVLGNSCTLLLMGRAQLTLREPAGWWHEGPVCCHQQRLRGEVLLLHSPFFWPGPHKLKATPPRQPERPHLGLEVLTPIVVMPLGVLTGTVCGVLSMKAPEPHHPWAERPCSRHLCSLGSPLIYLYCSLSPGFGGFWKPSSPPWRDSMPCYYQLASAPG